MVNINYDEDDAADAQNIATPCLAAEDICSQKGIVLNLGGGSYIYEWGSKLSTNQPKKKRGAPVRSGDLFLNHILELNDDISLAGLSQHDIDLVKRSGMRVFATGQFIEGSSFKEAECIGNNAYLAFDFDGTDLSDKEIKSIFWGAKRLIYATPSDGIKSGGRRLRVIVVCNRTMSRDEHAKVMKHFEIKITSMTPFHGLDVGKLKPYSKFLAPHVESSEKVNRKNLNRPDPLDIDALLREIDSDELKVKAPTRWDLSYVYPLNHIMRISPIKTRSQKCDDLLTTMVGGNRSIPVVKIAGVCKHMDNDFKRKMYQECQQRGADKSSLDSFRQYSGMH